MSEPGSHVCTRDNLPAACLPVGKEGRSVTDDLISGYTASGVKLAGRQYRLLGVYPDVIGRTREVAIDLLTEKEAGRQG